MKVFKCWYYDAYGMGAYADHLAIVVATCDSEALGLCLTQFDKTVAEHWTIDEVDTSKPHVYWGEDRSN